MVIVVMCAFVRACAMGDGGTMERCGEAGPDVQSPCDAGYDTPKDSASVKLSVEAATDGSVALASFTPKVLEFVVGNGDVCDALECAVTEMKKGHTCPGRISPHSATNTSTQCAVVRARH